MKSYQGYKPVNLLFTRLIILFTMFLLGLTYSQISIAANSDHLTQLISTKSCENCDLTNLELTYVDLYSANLANANLTNSRLSGQSLKSAILTSANLQSADLSSADLSYANLSNSNLTNADLSGAILSNADLTGADLTGANLENARLLGFAGKANLTATNLSEANLKGMRLNGLSFAGANLSHANISGRAYLAGADFSNAILDGADVSEANFSGANLQNTTWQDADLTGANLKRVDLTGADLTGAKLAEINLDNAILYETIGLDSYAQELIQVAIFVAEAESYLDAISYLEKIPSNTETYSQAQSLIAEYKKQEQIKVQKNLDADVQKKLDIAEEEAKSKNYKRAIKILQKIPSNTTLHTSVHNNIARYEEKQRLKETSDHQARERQIAQAKLESDALKRELPTIKTALDLFDPISVDIRSTSLKIVLPQQHITDQIYQAVVQYTLCPFSILGEIKLPGVSSIQVLNQSGRQGLVFEGGSNSCRGLTDRKLTTMTHKY